MLETLDLLIGMAVVMLFLSMAVTLLTQLVVDTLNTRGRHLREGVAELLQLIDAGIGRKNAKIIANYILRDEMVAGRVLGRRRLATTVHREELTKLILGFAVDVRHPLPVVQAGAAAAATGAPPKIAAAQEKLKASLTTNGVTDPAAALRDIRMTALQLEKSNPELSNAARMNAAILHHLETDFVGKLNGWFDQTIDRVKDRFAGWTRTITVIGAIVVAFGLQVDSLALMNRLSTDDATRTALVTYALKTDQESLKPAEGETAAQVLDRLNTAAGTDLIPLPPFVSHSYEVAPINKWAGIVRRLPGTVLDALTVKNWPGILLTAALLSLGAPFWYGALKNLVRLRSVIAGKDDEQRAERQATQSAAPAAAGGSPLGGGERGDLDAVG